MSIFIIDRVSFFIPAFATLKKKRVKKQILNTLTNISVYHPLYDSDVFGDPPFSKGSCTTLGYKKPCA